jgi:hypothetical protein
MSDSYIISYSKSSTGPWTRAGTSTGTSFEIKGLSGGTNYWVQIIAVDSITGLKSAPSEAGPFQAGGGTTPHVVIDPISGASHTSAVHVSGKMSGFSAKPSLQYILDPTLARVSGITAKSATTSILISWKPDPPITPVNLPAGSVVTMTNFSFTLPAMAAGHHALYVVADGTVVGSVTFSVS